MTEEDMKMIPPMPPTIDLKDGDGHRMIIIEEEIEEDDLAFGEEGEGKNVEIKVEVDKDGKTDRQENR